MRCPIDRVAMSDTPFQRPLSTNSRIKVFRVDATASNAGRIALRRPPKSTARRGLHRSRHRRMRRCTRRPARGRLRKAPPTAGSCYWRRRSRPRGGPCVTWSISPRVLMFSPRTPGPALLHRPCCTTPLPGPGSMQRLLRHLGKADRAGGRCRRSTKNSSSSISGSAARPRSGRSPNSRSRNPGRPLSKSSRTSALAVDEMKQDLRIGGPHPLEQLIAEQRRIAQPESRPRPGRTAPVSAAHRRRAWRIRRAAGSPRHDGRAHCRLRSGRCPSAPARNELLGELGFEALPRWWLIADCATCSWSAARDRLPAWTIPTKYLSWRRSIAAKILGNLPPASAPHGPCGVPPASIGVLRPPNLLYETCPARGRSLSKKF